MSSRHGQSLVEIVVLLGLAVLAIIAMQIYIQRGIQGKTKDLTDVIVRTDPGSKKMLSLQPYTATKATSSGSTKIVGTTRVSTGKGGDTTKTIVSETVTMKSSSYAKDKVD